MLPKNFNKGELSYFITKAVKNVTFVLDNYAATLGFLMNVSGTFINIYNFSRGHRLIWKGYVY